MSAKPAADTHDYPAIKTRFMQYEDGELRDVTDAMNDGNYGKALDACKRISALMNRINAEKGEGYE